MPALTLKNIPEDLYCLLKEASQAHRRSLNSEILYCVERTLVPSRLDVDGHLVMARKVREKTASYQLTDKALNAAKDRGRL